MLLHYVRNLTVLCCYSRHCCSGAQFHSCLHQCFFFTPQYDVNSGYGPSNNNNNGIVTSSSFDIVDVDDDDAATAMAAAPLLEENRASMNLMVHTDHDVVRRVRTYSNLSNLVDEQFSGVDASDTILSQMFANDHILAVPDDAAVAAVTSSTSAPPPPSSAPSPHDDMMTAHDPWVAAPSFGGSITLDSAGNIISGVTSSLLGPPTPPPAPLQQAPVKHPSPIKMANLAPGASLLKQSIVNNIHNSNRSCRNLGTISIVNSLAVMNHLKQLNNNNAINTGIATPANTAGGAKTVILPTKQLSIRHAPAAATAVNMTTTTTTTTNMALTSSSSAVHNMAAITSSLSLAPTPPPSSSDSSQHSACADDDFHVLQISDLANLPPLFDMDCNDLLDRLEADDDDDGGQTSSSSSSDEPGNKMAASVSSSAVTSLHGGAGFTVKQETNVAGVAEAYM